MSMIAGLARLDGAPMAAMGATGIDALPRLAARIGSRAPDGITIVHAEHAGFIYGKLAVTPGAEQEVQPRSTASLTISFDGRLDNRADLIAALDAGQDADDTALVLRGFARWGESTAEHLAGDFALVIWDALAQRLYAARDIAGVRPFLYREGHGWIAWASEIDILAAGIDAIPPPNEGMAGEYLAGAITSSSDTLFRGIFRLPPAHTLTASASGIRTRCYWTADPRTEIRYRRDDEYEAHLAELLRTVISARLRTERPAGIMLSGGLDSSTVAAIAAHACADRSVPCAGLRAFSLSEPGPADERRFFETMSAAAGIPSESVTAALPRRGQFREETARDLEVVRYPQSPGLDPLRARIRDSGARVVLTGMGGDDWLGPSSWALADLLRGRRVASLARRMWLESGEYDFSGWRSSLTAALWPVVPEALRTVVRLARRQGRPPAWIEPAFAARINLADRLAAIRASDVPFQSYEQIDIWRHGRSGARTHSLETTARAGSRFGIEHWHPYFDRRVIEFGLALPADQRWRNGRHKELLRRTMAAEVPAIIVNRLSSPAGGHAMIHALEAERPDGSETHLSACERLGWVRGPEIRRMEARAHALYRSGDKGFAWPAWTAWTVLAMDLWLDAASVVQ